MWAGNSADIFVFAAAAESTGSHYDTIHNIDFTADHLDTPGPGGTITAIDPALLNGSLSTAGFNADLHTALQGHLGAHHAVLFTPNGGTLRGETFLVVDLNGIAGYQANADLVIHLTGQSGALSVADFI